MPQSLRSHYHTPGAKACFCLALLVLFCWGKISSDMIPTVVMMTCGGGGERDEEKAPQFAQRSNL